MTTPTHAFFDIASKYGQIDPADAEAVQEWFTEILPTLPQERVDEILEELLKADGSVGEGEVARAYPKDAPIPSLASSPLASIPFLAGGWRDFFLSLLRLKK